MRYQTLSLKHIVKTTRSPATEIIPQATQFMLSTRTRQIQLNIHKLSVCLVELYFNLCHLGQAIAFSLSFYLC